MNIYIILNSIYNNNLAANILFSIVKVNNSNRRINIIRVNKIAVLFLIKVLSVQSEITIDS